jgi:hypothetical protein
MEVPAILKTGAGGFALPTGGKAPGVVHSLKDPRAVTHEAAHTGLTIFDLLGLLGTSDSFAKETSEKLATEENNPLYKLQNFLFPSLQGYNEGIADNAQYVTPPDEEELMIPVARRLIENGNIEYVKKFFPSLLKQPRKRSGGG